MYVYKTISKLTSARKCELIKLLTFIFAQRYSSSNSESSATLNQSKKQKKKKINAILTLSTFTKEKSDRIAKSEKLFWLLTTLIAFVIACIISMMKRSMMANSCVRK